VIEFKKWAMVVMSRGEHVDLPDPSNASRTVSTLAIMPLIDMVDHHLPMPDKPLYTDEDVLEHQRSGSHTNISYNAVESAVVLKAKSALKTNSAVTAGYGVRSNADYLLYHGFTMPREWTDMTLCTQYAMIELPLPVDLPTWKSRFLTQSYRFIVPACPSRRWTPHVIVAAARFLVASEDDLMEFARQAMKDPSLLDGRTLPKDEKFLHHGPREAVEAICDVKAQPPQCGVPLSVASERAAWDLVLNETAKRVRGHLDSVAVDDSILREDDQTSQLTVNQRHAVIVRREEKLALQRWCTVAASLARSLRGIRCQEDIVLTRVPESDKLENDEPRTRPTYWSRLLESPAAPDDHPSAECLVGFRH